VLVYGALSGPLPKLGVIAVAVLAAVVMLHPDARIQAVATLGALALSPALLLVDIWHSPQLSIVHRHPLLAVVVAIVALAAVVGAALALRRWPALLAGAVLVALPFRIPIQAGGQTNNLLVPLYFVIAAGSLSFIFQSLRRGSSATRAAVASGADPVAAPAGVPVPARWLERLLALYVVLYAVQATYSPSFEIALQYMVFFYVPFALAYCLVRRIDWTARLTRDCLALIVGLAVLFALVGFVEYATKTIFLNPKLIAANANHTYFAVNSVFFDSNIFGRFMALVMVLLGAVLLYSRRRRMLLGTLAVLAVVWVGLVLAVSGSSLGALLVGLATIAALRWKVRRAVFIAVGVVALAAALVAITPTTFGLNQGLNGASRGRAGLVSGGLEVFTSRPLWGYGSGSFQTEYGARHHALGQTTTASHTIPITIAAEQGLIGELAYVAFVLAALVMLLRRSRADPARVAIAAAFVALVFHTFLYADFLEDPITWTLLAIGAALARRGTSDSRRGRGELPARGRELEQQLA
jgi:O-antigen ligase